MTKNKIKIFFLILFLIILLFVFLGFNTFTGGNYREDLGFKIAKKIIPTNIKNQIKDFFKIASRKEKKVTESLINKEKELLKILNDENKEKELSKTLINREKELLGNIRLLNEKIVNKNSYIKALEDTVRNKDLNIEKLTNDSEFKQNN